MCRKRNIELATEIFKLAVHGNGVRDTASILDCAKDTVARANLDIGRGCQVILDELVRAVPTQAIQLDEMWSFRGSKKNRMWLHVALAMPSRLILSARVGPRGPEIVDQVVMESRMRTIGDDISVYTDGYQPYVAAIERWYGADVNFARLIKQQEKRRLKKASKQVLIGEVDEESITTNHLERLNGTFRDSLSRFKRKGYGFSRSQRHAQAAVDGFAAYYNLVRGHPGLAKSTPAMKAGIVKEAWSVDQLVRLALAKAEASADLEALPMPKRQAPVGRRYEYRPGFAERVEALLEDGHAAVAYLQPRIDELRKAEDLAKYRRASRGAHPMRSFRFEDRDDLRGRFKILFRELEDGSLQFSDIIVEERFEEEAA